MLLGGVMKFDIYKADYAYLPKHRRSPDGGGAPILLQRLLK
jgi:hypothetical protein